MAEISRWYFYGEVTFATTTKRTQTVRKMNDRIAASGLVAELWDQIPISYPDWTTGGLVMWTNAINGLPSVRFCVASDSRDLIDAAYDEVYSTWGVDNESWYAIGEAVTHTVDSTGFVSDPGKKK